MAICNGDRRFCGLDRLKKRADGFPDESESAGKWAVIGVFSLVMAWAGKNR